MDNIFTYAALSFIKSFNDTLKQEKKYNKDAYNCKAW